MTDLAKLRNPGYSWDGSDYTKGRTGSADREGLKMYAAPIAEILKLAPTGFPSHGLLRQTLQELHEKHTIFDGVDKTNVWRVATDAADTFRVMCKHIYNWSKNGTPPEDFKHLVDLITPSTPAKKRPAITFPEFDDDDEDENEVEVTKERCMCPACMASKPAEIFAVEGSDENQEDDEAAASDTDMDIDIPSSVRGGQRQETEHQEDDEAAASDLDIDIPSSAAGGAAPGDCEAQAA